LPVNRVDLIGCGAVNLDLIYRLPASFELSDQLPARGAEEGLDEETRVPLDAALAEHEPFRSGGGQAANVVYALRRFGHQAVMLGRVGDDPDGERLAEELGPEATQLLVRHGTSGRVYVLLDEGGERRNLVSPGTNDQFAAADLPKRLPHARFAYFSSFVGDEPLAGQLALLERLPRDTDVAFDPGELYAARGVKRYLPLLQQTAYLFATEHELELLCGVELSGAIEFLLKVGVDTIVCKMGERGARLITRRGEIYVPPSPTLVVDVTGAGDLFAAGFLGGLLEELPLEAAGRLAAWTAARGIGGLGRSSYPDAAAWREQVELERSL
jgi:ribokinase